MLLPGVTDHKLDPKDFTLEDSRPETPDDIEYMGLSTAGDIVGPGPRSWWWLRLMAANLRGLNYLGMGLHHRAVDCPPRASFTRRIPSTLSETKGEITLHFYTPERYERAKLTGLTYPALINFHGGGFTIGSATDDAHFAEFVIYRCNAVVVSVDYRLSPEHPFPIPVDDAADALLYIIRSAARLHIDPLRLATSGFSAGGNLAFTSLLRLTDHLTKLNTDPAPAVREHPVPAHKFVAVASWYPVLNYTIPRAAKRAMCTRPSLTLPDWLTRFFDASYLADPTTDLTNPYLSPVFATDEHLAAAIPQKVYLYTCEWDMLRIEGRELALRLEEEPLSREVELTEIPETTHAWDKAARFWREKKLDLAEENYDKCAIALRKDFGVLARTQTVGGNVM